MSSSCAIEAQSAVLANAMPMAGVPQTCMRQGSRPDPSVIITHSRARLHCLYERSPSRHLRFGVVGYLKELLVCLTSPDAVVLYLSRALRCIV